MHYNKKIMDRNGKQHRRVQRIETPPPDASPAQTRAIVWDKLLMEELEARLGNNIYVAGGTFPSKILPNKI
jgi:hypothetical protein